METAVRWSHSSIAGNERFLFVEVVGKSFKLCRVKSRKKGFLKFEVVAEQKKVPAFRAFDWSPKHEGIVAVGQSSGEATVLRIDDGSQAAASFPIRNQRLCNAVAFNNQGLLATGLDKVRTDHCLNIWDLRHQLPSGNTTGFSGSSGRIHNEPLHKLASSEPITSIKFFHRDPQTLLTGVKGQFVRLYDLREGPGTASLQFTTRCVNNLAIDSMDENYFASCYPTNGPIISIWDRRAGSRPPVAQTGFFSASSAESSSLQASLELREATEAPGSIWSLRFSSTRRGCLGMLSSAGHFRTYDIGREFRAMDDVDSGAKTDIRQRKAHEAAGPEELYLNGIQDLQHAYHHRKEGRPEDERIVSFDFMNLGGTWNEPKAITLTDNGAIAELSIPMIPEPENFSSMGMIHRGRQQMQRPSDLVNVVLGHDSNKMPATRVTAAADKVPGAVEIVAQYVRCLNGYLFSLDKNRTITSEHSSLQRFWSWIDWVSRERIAGKTVQDGLDLSYLGIHALLIDDCGPNPQKTRIVGSSATKLAEATERLVKRLNIPAMTMCATDLASQRQICLYYLEQAWTGEQLEKLISDLVTQKQHTKAAAMAIFAGEARLAYRALRSSSVRFHKMLAMAIVSATKRAAGGDDEKDDEWAETIEALASDLNDPFAHAILCYVKENDWEAVVEEESLPLRYRIGVALRWLKDTSLIEHIAKMTRAVAVAGNIDGIVLTGLGSSVAFELLSAYLRHTGDVQTAVLALTWTIPRYIDDPMTKRKFAAWRETYRECMNSWNLHFDRADFDIGSSKIAVDMDGQRLRGAPKPQVALTCGYCNRSIAHFPPGAREVDGSAADFGLSTNSNNNNNKSGNNTTHRTQRHPLSSEKAAAIGTICPRCGRRLPRCGVCDMELGMPDPSFLKWSVRGPTQRKPDSTDLSASIGGGSVITTLGPGTTRSNGDSDPQQLSAVSTTTLARSSKSDSDPVTTTPQPAAATASSSRAASELEHEAAAAAAAAREVRSLHKFIAYCIKCNHGFHAHHAVEWFSGITGFGAAASAGSAAAAAVGGGGGGGVEGGKGGRRQGHQVCPVSECSCTCEMGL